MTDVVRMPMTAASRRGVSAVANEASDHRVVLTSHGRTVAVVDSPERLDADMGRLRAAAWEVLEAASNLYSDRSEKYSLRDACEKLGFDLDELRDEVMQEDAPA